MNFIKRAFPLRRMMSIKKSLKKFLPDFLFNGIVSSWRFLLNSSYRFKSLSFKGITLKEVNFSGIKYKLYLDPSNGFIDREFFTKGIFEPAIYGLILKYSNKNGVFVDIGSNIGQYASFASPLFKAVHAFEPVPKLYEQNLSSIKANSFTGNTFLHNLAVGSESGTVKMSCPPENMGGSSILANYGSIPPFEVKVVTLDEFLPQDVRPVSLIKMDVEGYEYPAFMGMADILRKDMPVVIFEFSPTFLRPNFGSDSPVIMLRYLLDFGYSLFEVFDDGVLEYIEPANLKNYASGFDDGDRRQADIIALPNA